MFGFYSPTEVREQLNREDKEIFLKQYVLNRTDNENDVEKLLADAVWVYDKIQESIK